MRKRHGFGDVATLEGPHLRRENPASETALDPGPSAPAEVAIRSAFRIGLNRLRENHGAALDGSEAGVHTMRTTARRVRTALRVFRSLLHEAWARGLEAELKWLAGALGGVRDLDVQEARLHAAAGELADDLAPLFAALESCRVNARANLDEALRSDRYASLIRSLADAADQPPTEAEARESCRTALPPLAARAWKRLKKAGRSLTPDDPAEAFHQARILAKRARYTAEAIAPALGPLRRKAERFAARAAAIQEVLGEHQDATVSRSLVEATVAERPDDVPFALAAGRMIERQAAAAGRARERFNEVWHHLDQGKVRGWLKASH